jgi:hypothetical protein
VHKLPQGLLSYGLGERGYHRVVGADSFGLGEGDLLAGVELNRYDGPWAVSQNLKKSMRCCATASIRTITAMR